MAETEDYDKSATPLAHKTTHQHGGTDEVSVQGLAGTLADPQTPAAHKTSHQLGGSDALSVDGLSGLLADGQTPLAHKTSHQLGGSDVLSVAGLSGLLATAQTPAAHKTSHQLGGSDALSIAGLSGQLADNQPSTQALVAGLTTASSPTFAGLTLSGLTTTRIPFLTTSGQLTDSSLFTFDGTNGILRVTSPYGLNVILTAGATDKSAVLRLTTINRVGESDTGQASLVFMDLSTISLTFSAAVGNAPASSRYGGLICGSDRDGTKLPFEIFTTDTGGTARKALHITANQTAGTAGLVGVGMTPTHNLDVAGNLRCSTGFGCNGTIPQTAYASGGALAAYVTGAFGLDTADHMSKLHALIVAIRAALVANGIMS